MLDQIYIVSLFHPWDLKKCVDSKARPLIKPYYDGIVNKIQIENLQKILPKDKTNSISVLHS